MANRLKNFFTRGARNRIHVLQSGTNAPLESAQKVSNDIVQATTDKLFSEGFPDEMVAMFKKTADETDSVIMSRAPGDATPELIEHGHDLKGYQVKAKSCSWGPMSGFLCQIPCFNKKGIDKIGYNDGYYAKYFKYIRDKQKDDLIFRASVLRKEDGFTPFVPLQLFDKRKEQMLKHKSIIHQETHGDDIYGVAVHTKEDKGKPIATVWMEFMLRKAPYKTSDGGDLWSVFHGRIYTHDKKWGWQDFFNARISYMDGEPGRENVSTRKKLLGGRKVGELVRAMPKNLVPSRDYQSVTAPEEVIKSLTVFIKSENKLPSGAPDAHPGFFSLCVAQNPYPAYAIMERLKGESTTAYTAYKKAQRKEFYKNAVTGDYDLFAVWPIRPEIGWEDMLRLSDIQEKIGDLYSRRKAVIERKAYKQGFFVSLPGKPFGLGLVGSPNVYIDIIPGFDEIEAWEDPEVGNVNSAVMLAAQTFNSFVCEKMLENITNGRIAGTETGKERHFAYPNLAFHSDEGGRPGIDEIDFPVGVFLPLKLATMPEIQKIFNPKYERNGIFIRHMLLDKHEYDRFIGLAIALRNTCLVSFNHVWLTYLFALVGGTTKSTGFFKPMAKEREKIRPEGLARLRAQLSHLFLGGTFRIARGSGASNPWGMGPTKTWPNEVKAANASMDELAKAFVAAVDKKMAMDKQKTLKKAMMSIPDRTNPVETKNDASDVSSIPAPSLANNLGKR